MEVGLPVEMVHFVEVLMQEHDLVLLALAASVCLFGFYSTSALLRPATSGPQRVAWTVMFAVCAATTVWATNFIAILAYRVDLPITYEAAPTAWSYAVGLSGMVAGCVVALATPTGRWRKVLGGAIVGLSAAALHYTGMLAVRFPGTMHYDADQALLSALVASLLGGAAFRFSFAENYTNKVCCALLLMGMTVGLYALAIGAVGLQLGVVDAGAHGMSRTFLGTVAAAVSLLLLTIGLIAGAMDQQLSRRTIEETSRLLMLANSTSEGLVIHKSGRVIDANDRALAILRADRGAVVGRRLASWFPDSTGDQRDAATPEDTIASRRLAMRRRDGSEFPAEISGRQIKLADGQPAQVMVIRDLTVEQEAKTRIAELSRLAHYDPLTELPNRRLLIESSALILQQAGRDGSEVAALMIDLDGFKLVNDLHGHEAGDEVLRIIGLRLTNLFRQDTTVARLGGDEFAIFVHTADARTEVPSIASRIIEKVAEPVRLSRGTMNVNASIGIAVFPQDGEDAATLLREADMAMYKAKADGKSTFRFFDREMTAPMELRIKIQERLRSAIDSNAFQLHYQPIVSSWSGKTTGFEALLRWTDEELGAVSPVALIAVAEEAGLIEALGAWTLRTACADAATWPEPLRVCVNLSPFQFRRRGATESVESVLSATGLRPERLELEITENVFLDDKEAARQTAAKLRDLGVSLSLDDFGTGFSSLSYLQELPFDTLKIDKTFVAKLTTDARARTIVQAIVTIAAGLDMRLVAEGVETAEQYQLLRRLGCHEQQGYSFSTPLPARNVADYLAREASEQTHQLIA